MPRKELGRYIGIFMAAGLVGGCSADARDGLTLAGPSVVASTNSKPSSTPPPFVFPEGCCYYNDTVVRTVVPPATTPQEGRDNFYAIANGVGAQKGVVAVAPGDAGYHGGHWKFYLVTFVVAPYLLTSEDAVLAAEAAGDVTIARIPGNDFRCPIQL